MQARTLLATGMTLWIYAVAFAASAAEDKPQPGATPAAASKDGKPAAEAKGVKPAGPRLEMGKEHPTNSGKERDMRHCLDMPDAKEVIRCYEKKK